MKIRLSTIDEIERLYADHGQLRYGEAVTQIEHALQCAALAEAANATPSLVIAALLHDIGHLLEPEPTSASADDRHEALGAQVLKHLFDADVRAPIGLHVAAKRYLCFREPGYLEALSLASKASLLAQGGPFTAGQASAFEQRRSWREAVALRRFDDAAKCDGAFSRSFGDYAPLLRRMAIVT